MDSKPLIICHRINTIKKLLNTPIKYGVEIDVRSFNKKIVLQHDPIKNGENFENWIKNYILWELSLINQLGYEINFFDNENLESNNINQINLNNKSIKVPRLIQKNNTSFTDIDVKEALQFHKHLIMENFIIPNNLKFPLSRNILEKYF